MLDLSKEEDPNEEHPQNDGSLSMPKRELFDKLPPTLTINVTTTSMVASVDVLPSWRTQGVLQIEIAQTNLGWLLEEPPAEPAPFRPELGQENVFWIGSRSMVQCRWWDSKKSKKRAKSIIVEFTSDMEEEAKLDAINTAAAELQEFYDTHHNLQKNMPGQNQTTEEDDAMSAESTHREPVQKTSKTD